MTHDTDVAFVTSDPKGADGTAANEALATASTSAPAASSDSRDARDPELRLDALFDAGPRLVLRPDVFPSQVAAGPTATSVADGERRHPGMIAAVGVVDGRQVVAFAADPRVSGGALGEDACAVVVLAYREARRRGCPIVGLWHSGGARLDEGVRSLHGVGQVFAAMTRASGRIPQISVVLGAAAGGAAYGPALTDVVIQAPSGKIFVTGPDVVRWATGEEVTADDLGGVVAHGRHSGVTHVPVPDEETAHATARRLCGLLGAPGRLDRDAVQDIDLGRLLPERRNVVYDVRPLVHGVLDRVGDGRDERASDGRDERVGDGRDESTGLELQADWAANVVTMLGRFGGRSVGVVANNPAHLVGCLDSISAEKASRFVRLCDAFGLPIIVLVDVPGYLPGSGEERGGIVRRGAKLLHAFAETVVPTVTIVTRKAYGGAYIAMNSRSLGAGASFAWPGAQIAVMSPVSAVRVMHRRALSSVSGDAQRAVLEQVLADEYLASTDGVDAAVRLGIIDGVVRPDRTRGMIAAALLAQEEDRGGHGNIPL